MPVRVQFVSLPTRHVVRSIDDEGNISYEFAITPYAARSMACDKSAGAKEIEWKALLPAKTAKAQRADTSGTLPLF